MSISYTRHNKASEKYHEVKLGGGGARGAYLAHGLLARTPPGILSLTLNWSILQIKKTTKTKTKAKKKNQKKKKTTKTPRQIKPRIVSHHK